MTSFSHGDIHQETLDLLISPKGSVFFIFLLFNGKIFIQQKGALIKIYILDLFTLKHYWLDIKLLTVH